MKQRELMSYVNAMRDANDIIESSGVDFLVVPMMGSVPFIDSMNIVNDNFDASKAVYMPASSRIRDVNKVIKKWYGNFLNDIVDIGAQNFPKVMGIDEVVSGASIMRCFNHIDSASQEKRKKIRQNLMDRLHNPIPSVSIEAIGEIDMLTDNEFSYDISMMRDRVQKGIYKVNKNIAREDSRFMRDLIRNVLEDKLVYKSIGIEDSKGSVIKEYGEMKNNNRITPVSVERIVTMDQPWLCPPRFKTVKGIKQESYVIHTPEVYDFKVTSEYMEFLSGLARVVGKDPAKVYPVNMQAILESNKYLKN